MALVAGVERVEENEMLNLVDLSTFQRRVRYSELATAVAGGWIKATDARKHGAAWFPFVDEMHEDHHRGLRSAGRPTGSYCFGHPTQDVNQSADFFVQHSFFDQLRPVIDMESLADGNAIPPNAGDWTAAWLARVRMDSGVEPMVYASSSYAETMIRQCPSLRDVDHWIAAYPGAMTPPDHMPTVRGLLAARVLAWQWTGTGRLPGIDGNADRDVAPSLEPLYVVAPDLDAGHERLGM